MFTDFFKFFFPGFLYSGALLVSNMYIFYSIDIIYRYRYSPKYFRICSKTRNANDFTMCFDYQMFNPLNRLIDQSREKLDGVGPVDNRPSTD